MKLYLDTADIEQINLLNDYYSISGVTTNPTILTKEDDAYLSIVKRIREIIGEDKTIFVQVIGKTAETMVDESKFICKEISGCVVPKIPVTEEGIKAIKRLALENIPTLATTVYTPLQALTAAMAGASYVAPYVNRIDNLSGDGVGVVSEIKTLFTNYNLSTEILAASFKNIRQVQEVALKGVEAVTVSPEIMREFVTFPSTQVDVEVFRKQWKDKYGTEKLN